MIPRIDVPESRLPRAVELPDPRVAFESPSLAPSEVPAYELKFLLTEGQAREVEDRARARLVPDPHGDPALGFAYRTTSLYFDTAEFEVFRRLSPFKRRKHRLRRYDGAASVFLERKTKRGDEVRKRRTLVPDSELPLLAQPMSATTWPGHWFHRHLLRRRLLPVCRIAYQRLALVGQSDEGPLRLTFDRHIRGLLTDAWDVEAVEEGHPLLTGQVICEFKYRGFLPPLFKEIVQAMRLTPGPVSKYRAFVRAYGPAGEWGGHA